MWTGSAQEGELSRRLGEGHRIRREGRIQERREIIEKRRRKGNTNIKNTTAKIRGKIRKRKKQRKRQIKILKRRKVQDGD